MKYLLVSMASAMNNRPVEGATKQKITYFQSKYVQLPLSYVVYGSLGFVVVALLLFLFTKKKDR